MYHFLNQQGQIDTEREEAYRNAISSPSRLPDTVEGVITFKDATTLEVDYTNMPANTISISKQCVDNDELMLGGVFTSTLKLSIMTDRPRYDFYDARIELFYYITVGYEEPEQEGDEPEPIWEEVPLGVFYVADAERPNDTVTLTAYDSMTMLDKSLGGLQLNGTPWAIFQQIEIDTGYELGFDEAFVNTFPNAEYQIHASESDGIQTYRDVVKEICQMLGCFALDDRTGKLMIKKFSTTDDLELDTSSWYTCVPSDYRCAYKGISVKSRSGVYSKVNPNPLTYGLILLIEDAPAFDYGSSGAQEDKIENLYDVVTQINYTPCSIDMPGDPTFDCGDRFELTTIDDATIHTLVTSVEWKFHQGMDVESAGINPYLESSTVATDEGSRLLNQAVERSKIQFVNFTNATAITVADEDTEIIGECIFRPTAVADALFVGTILVDATVADVITDTSTATVTVPVSAVDQQGQPAVVTDLQGNPLTLTGTATNTHTYYRDGKADVSIYYTLNGIKIPSNEDPYIATEKIENGKHIISLSYPLNALEANTEYTFRIHLTQDGASSFTIPIRSLRGTLLGQEINDTSAFDGRIKVEGEQFDLINLGSIGVGEFTHGEFTISIINDPNVTPYQQMDNQLALIKALEMPDDVSEDISLYNIASMSITPIQEGTGEFVPDVYFQSLYISPDSNNDDIFTTESGDKFITEGTGGEPT